ncbi:MAG: Ig-like domain-containing protein [Isosphaeraceae bacterium]
MEGHRRTNWNVSVEDLEGRILLSGVGEPAGTSVPAAVQHSSLQFETTTSLQSSTKSTASGNRLTLVATVHTAGKGREVGSGLVRFTEISPTPQAIGSAHVNHDGVATVSTSRLNEGASHEILAHYIPVGKVFAASDATVNVSVTPAAATSLRISAPHFFGAPGTPITFYVTALDRAGQPVTDYTGTISLYSPTDHAAQFSMKAYTFTTADQGTHEFADGVTFHKGGAEVLKVDQVNNTQIHGKAKFGIE